MKSWNNKKIQCSVSRVLYKLIQKRVVSFARLFVGKHSTAQFLFAVRISQQIVDFYKKISRCKKIKKQLLKIWNFMGWCLVHKSLGRFLFVDYKCCPYQSPRKKWTSNFGTASGMGKFSLVFAHTTRHTKKAVMW